MVLIEAAIGWLALLWVAWLLEANWTVLSRTRRGVGGTLRRIWSLIDNQRLAELGGFVAGIFAGPIVVGMALGFVGGLIGGVSLTILGLTEQQTLGVLTAAVIAMYVVHRVRRAGA